jgi:hypothetical protein
MATKIKAKAAPKGITLKPVDAIPSRKGGKRISEYRETVAQFVAGDTPIVEVELGDKNARNVYAGIQAILKNAELRATVAVALREGVVYLAKK